MSANDESAVRLDSVANRYESVVEGHLSLLEFVMEADRMIITHTLVPPELRGRGIAEKLTRAALDDARTKRLKVVPACSYAARYIERHAEYGDLVAP